MKVVFSNRAYSSILAETTEKIKTETGGLFLGKVIDDTWYVVEAIDPGPKSIFEVAYFEYDQKYTQHLINKIANLYNEKLELIGLWHRHPGSFDQFSSTDDGTNAKYASMRKCGAISALVNVDPKFRLTVYHVNSPCRYSTISYDVGDNLIPDELLAYKSPDKFMDLMDKIMLGSGNGRNRVSDKYRVTRSLASFMDIVVPYMEDKICTDVETNNLASSEETQDELMDAIIEDITFFAEELGVEVAITLDENYMTIYQETVDKTTKLYFMVSIVKESVVMSYEDKCYLYHSGMLREMMVKAAQEKAKENAEETIKRNKSNGMVDAVRKIIKLNRNEE